MQWTVNAIDSLSAMSESRTSDTTSYDKLMVEPHSLQPEFLNKKCSQWSNPLDSAILAWSDDANTRHWPKMVFFGHFNLKMTFDVKLLNDTDPSNVLFISRKCSQRSSLSNYAISARSETASTSYGMEN